MPEPKALDRARHLLHEIGKCLQDDELTEVGDLLQSILTDQAQVVFPCREHGGAHNKPAPLSTVKEWFLETPDSRPVVILECGHRVILPDEVNEMPIGGVLPCIWCAEECHS